MVLVASDALSFHTLCVAVEIDCLGIGGNEDTTTTSAGRRAMTLLPTIHCQ